MKRAGSLAILVVALALTGCRRSRRCPGAGRRQGPGGGGVLPAGSTSPQRVAGARRRRSTNLTRPASSRTTSSSPSSQTAEVADADLVRLRARLPAGRRRRRRAERAAERRPRRRPTSCDAARGPTRGRRRRTRTSGRTRADGRRSPTRSPTQLVEVDPTTRRLRAPTRRPAQPTSSTLDRDYAERAEGLRAATRSWSATTRSATSARYGLQVEADRRPLPRRRADPGRPGRLQDLIGTDGITTVFSERLVSPQARARPWPTTWASRTAVLDPIEGLSDETADEDYLSLMRENLAALREGERMSPE